jgi:hypothetical protein
MSVLLDFIILACLLIPSCLHFSLKESERMCILFGQFVCLIDCNCIYLFDFWVKI